MITELPSLVPFHKKICLLDFYQDLKDEYPNIKESLERRNEDETTTVNQPDELKDLKEVSLTFSGTSEYTEEWERLFMLEVKAQLLRSALSEKQEAEVCQLKDAEFLDPFYMFTLQATSQYNVAYKVYDVVLFTLTHPDERQVLNMITIVEYYGQGILKLKTNFEKNSKKFEQMQENFVEDSQWYVQKICNLATIHREYQALYSVGDLMLKDYIVFPDKKIKEDSEKGVTYFQIPPELNTNLQKRYNASQYEAIRESLKKEGVTLIQGPPGTGKTFTILGILSVLLHSTSNTTLRISEKAKNKKAKAKTRKTRNKKPVEESDIDDSTDEEIRSFCSQDAQKTMPWLNKKQGRAKCYFRDLDKNELTFQLKRHLVYPIANMTDSQHQLPEMKPDVHARPQKILICAPSNAAIDQIIRLVVKKGLYTPEGNYFAPSIVRIGPNYHSDLKSVSIEALSEAETQASNGKETQIEVKNRILRRTKLICSTLSVAGSKMLYSSGIIFDTVIIDEAAQAVELSTLIPLKYKCRRLILIGDPKQLPATIFSKTCEKFKYDTSLFQRLQQNGQRVILLQEQYRMHPIIAKLISDSFYSGKVANYDGIDELIGDPEIYEDLRLQPITFYHSGGHESFANNSYQNISEAQFIVQLLSHISTQFPKLSFRTVGVITSYSSQVKLIRESLSELGSKFSEVEVHTVDGFQGREKDIIIFSCVRSTRQKGEPASKTIGFLRDKRRMNVSLSRARQALLIVGNVSKMYTSRKWKKLIDYSYGLESLYDYWDAKKKRIMPLKKSPKDTLVQELTKYVS